MISISLNLKSFKFILPLKISFKSLSISSSLILTFLLYFEKIKLCHLSSYSILKDSGHSLNYLFQIFF